MWIYVPFRNKLSKVVLNSTNPVDMFVKYIQGVCGHERVLVSQARFLPERESLLQQESGELPM